MSWSWCFLQAISNILRSGVSLSRQAGSANTFGDDQLEVYGGHKGSGWWIFFMFASGISFWHMRLSWKCHGCLSSSVDALNLTKWNDAGWSIGGRWMFQAAEGLWSCMHGVKWRNKWRSILQREVQNIHMYKYAYIALSKEAFYALLHTLHAELNR